MAAGPGSNRTDGVWIESQEERLASLPMSDSIFITSFSQHCHPDVSLSFHDYAMRLSSLDLSSTVYASALWNIRFWRFLHFTACWEPLVVVFSPSVPLNDLFTWFTGPVIRKGMEAFFCVLEHGQVWDTRR